MSDMSLTIEKSADVWAELETQAAGLSPDLRKAFLATIQRAKNVAPIGRIEEALRYGRVDDAIVLIMGMPSQNLAFWGELVHATRRALVEVAHKEIKAAGKLLGPKANVFVGFDIANPRTIRAINAADLSLVRDTDALTREGIRTYITAQLVAGKNPRTVVPELVGRVMSDGTRKGGILGLTDRQTQAVANYRSSLENLSKDALNRALRDKRFDSTIARAIEDDEELSPEKIDQLVGRYQDNFLAHRAETIARTESAKAQRDGIKASWDQAVDSGVVSSSALTKRWVTSKDERVRPAISSTGRVALGFGIEYNHRQMEGQIVGYDELFTAPDTGEQAWGPPVGVNCRCLCWIKPLVGQR